jgi:hypothetical protein
MSERWRTPPSSDAELTARIEEALRPAPLAATERARFAARVRERALGAETQRSRWAPLVALGGLTATAALFAALVLRAPTLAPPAAAPEALAGDALLDSWEEELRYAPEWIERDDGFVDAALLPDRYALASALLEP